MRSFCCYHKSILQTFSLPWQFKTSNCSLLYIIMLWLLMVSQTWMTWFIRCHPSLSHLRWKMLFTTSKWSSSHCWSRRHDITTPGYQQLDRDSLSDPWVLLISIPLDSPGVITASSVPSPPVPNQQSISTVRNKNVWNMESLTFHPRDILAAGWYCPIEHQRWIHASSHFLLICANPLSQQCMDEKL